MSLEGSHSTFELVMHLMLLKRFELLSLSALVPKTSVYAIPPQKHFSYIKYYTSFSEFSGSVSSTSSASSASLASVNSESA